LRNEDERVITLPGKWLIRLDPKDEGKRSKWFEKPGMFKDTISVPGCWQGQGFGDDGKDFVKDFRISARVFRATYKGTGWYAKKLSIPEDWKGRRIWLNFGGAYPSAEVFLNGEKLGSHGEPFVPFGFEATSLVSFENENFLAVRISEENRLYGYAFNWMGDWSGLYRSVELSATGDSFMDRCWLHPDVDSQRIRCTMKVQGKAKRDDLNVHVFVREKNGRQVATASRALKANKALVFNVPVSSPKLWSPDSPYLYRVDVVLRSGNEVTDALAERVGFVKLSTKGKHFCINDEPYYIRQTGDFISSPETGSPDFSRERWRKKLKALRNYGYNSVRCQSYVPTPEYYDVADEAGLLIQGEMGMLGAWGGHTAWHIYAWPQPHPKFREKMRSQWNHTVMRDVNHPSALIYCMSNELPNEALFPEVARRSYRETKKIKPNAFVIWTDGGLNKKLPGDFVNTEGANDNKTSLPVIQHEFRWWSSFPDVRTKKKYKGAIRPYQVEIAEEAASKAGIKNLLPKIAHNSQRLQFVEMKTKMERCRRDFKRLAGISHFNAMDIGLSPQGVLDEFYEKKLIDAGTWLQTNGDTVIMMDRDFDGRIGVAGETVQVRLCISDFSHPPMAAKKLEWRLRRKNVTVAAGSIAFTHKPYCTSRLGKIKLKTPEVKKPALLVLSVELRDGKRRIFNEWNFWAFPKKARLPDSVAAYGACRLINSAKKAIYENLTPESAGKSRTKKMIISASSAVIEMKSARVLITEKCDKTVIEFVRGGGGVLLIAGEGLVRPFFPKFGFREGQYFFLPPASYPPYEDGHQGTIVRNHKMLGDFPHEGFCDLQFFRMIDRHAPIELDPFGKLKEEPVIRQIGTYQVCQKLAYLVEFALGKGGIIISSLNLDPKLPEARYLLSQILKYAAGSDFHPKNALSAKAIGYLISETNL